MSIGVQAFVGSRLTEARLARGLYKKSLADMIAVSSMAISRYEAGIDKPQRERLDALAEQLKFPVEFFLRAEWPEQIETVFWRRRTSETKTAREMTEQRIKWLCELFAFLESEVDFPPLKLPGLDIPSDFRLITSEMIERAAKQVREFWKLGDRPIPDVTLALENAGIPVVTLDFMSDKQDGFFFSSKYLQRPFVGINTNGVSAARARFDAGHELGHLLLHQHVSASRSRDPAAHRLMEQQAHRFAGAFLLPSESFRNEFGVISLDYFCDRKRKWGMSIAAMIFRAADLGLIDDGEKAALYRKMGRRRWRGPCQEPFDNDMPLECPRMLRRGVEVLVSEGVFSKAAIHSALALPPREIEQIAGLPLDFLSQEEVLHLAEVKRVSRVAAFDLESGKIIEFPQRKN